MEAVEMLKRSIFAMTLVGLIAAGAGADAVIHVDTGVDNGNGNNWGINVMPDGDGTAQASVWIENTGAETFGIGAVIMELSSDPDLGYFWTFGSSLSEAVDWFLETDPNFPQAVWGGTPGASPAEVEPGGLLQIGTLDLSIPQDAPLGGEYGFSFSSDGDSIFTNDEDFAGIPATGASQTFTAVPEPATLALLAIGGLYSVRRRR
jgi:hypothetical protein